MVICVCVGMLFMYSYSNMTHKSQFFRIGIKCHCFHCFANIIPFLSSINKQKHRNHKNVHKLILFRRPKNSLAFFFFFFFRTITLNNKVSFVKTHTLRSLSGSSGRFSRIFCIFVRNYSLF